MLLFDFQKTGPLCRHVACHETAFAGLSDCAHEALFRAYIQNATHLPLREEAITTYFAPWQEPDGKEAFHRQIAHANNDNIREAEQRYRKPPFEVLLVWGKHDSFIPLGRGEQLNGAIETDSFTVIPKAAHIVLEDAPEAVVGTLLQNL